MILKYRNQQSEAGNPRNPNNIYRVPSKPSDADIPNFTFLKKPNDDSARCRYWAA
jgi:hypothetical protein